MNRTLLFVSIVTTTTSAALLACTTEDPLSLIDDVPVEGDAANAADTTGQAEGSADASSGSDVVDATNDVFDSSTVDAKDTGAADAHPDANDAACPVTLTVKDVFNWCSVSIDGGTAFTAGNQTVCAANGGTVHLSASPLGGFILGPAPWHDTAGDLDGGGELGASDGGSASTTIVVGDGGAACAWVCCPFPDGGGCPTTNQCP